MSEPSDPERPHMTQRLPPLTPEQLGEAGKEARGRVERRTPGRGSASTEETPALPSQSSVGGSEEPFGIGADDLLSELRGEVSAASSGPAERPNDSQEVDLIGRLAHDLHLPSAAVSELLAALRESGRLLLVGPPFAGKTYIARRLAIHIAGHLDRVLVLRLHPSLGYGELIDSRGRPGLVRDLCERAAQGRTQGERFVLVLDELDQGDAGRALGEFVGALSERGQRVLLGSGEPLVIPRNLHVIATARELPHDPQLLGRFPIVRLSGEESLRRYLSEVRPGYLWVADLVRNLNARLARLRPGLAIGGGAFMEPELDLGRLRRTWQRAILPLLESLGVDPSGLDYDSLRQVQPGG